jgi:hypothetical protein
MAMPACSMYEVITVHDPGSYDLKHLSYGLAEPISIDRDGFCPCSRASRSRH